VLLVDTSAWIEIFRRPSRLDLDRPCVESPITKGLVDAAVDISRRARRSGMTVRSSVDCLIAACASRHRLTVMHRDRDYANLATIVPIEHIDITLFLRDPDATATTRRRASARRSHPQG
jgi:predicted nucleic acid-binding protein